MEILESPSEGETTPHASEPETPIKDSPPRLHASMSFNQAIKGVAEFIEVAIHTILYVRRIYPPDLFVRRKKYDTPVFQSRHPALNEYISGAAKAIADELALGNVNKVIVVIKDKEQAPLERFIFFIQNMLDVDSYNRNTRIQDAMTLATLSQYFRSFLLKLTMVESQLGLLEPQGDASFTILLELYGDHVPSAEQDQDPPPWVPADNRNTTSGVSDNASLHFLRVVDTGIMSLSLAVQESDLKLRRLKKPPGNDPDPQDKGKEKEKEREKAAQ